jgi:hypothetical protein
MSFQSTRFATLALTLFLSACGSTMTNPDVARNPHPRMHYQLTMIINGAPGPFNDIKGRMLYEIANRSCVPEDPISGTRSPPSEWPEFELTRVSDGVYVGDFYLDLFQGGDYFGLGVCQWKLTSVTVAMEANKNEFYPGISNEEILAHAPITSYFSKSQYTDTSSPGVSGGAMFDPATEETKDQFFSIALTAKEAN